jgi:hypothetical protein
LGPGLQHSSDGHHGFSGKGRGKGKGVWHGKGQGSSFSKGQSVGASPNMANKAAQKYHSAVYTSAGGSVSMHPGHAASFVGAGPQEGLPERGYTREHPRTFPSQTFPSQTFSSQTFLRTEGCPGPKPYGTSVNSWCNSKGGRCKGVGKGGGKAKGAGKEGQGQDDNYWVPFSKRGQRRNKAPGQIGDCLGAQRGGGAGQ